MAYVGFKKLEGKLAAGGARNPGAVAASIGRHKYGAAKFNRAAASGKSMRGMSPMHKKAHVLSHMKPKSDGDMDE